MSKIVINITLIILGLIVLYYIAQQLFSEHVIPSFGDIVASSTLNVANVSSTSTPYQSAFQKLFVSVASSSAVINSTNKKISSTLYADVTLLPSTSILTPKGSVKAFIAKDDATREAGLSGQKMLPKGVGMIFAFDTAGKYGFWMKDMDFSLDMIWIDANKRVVGVTKNVLPSSYPFVFMPPKDILYVLEMNAGSVTEFGLTTGTQLKFTAF
ncbi:MAG: DUF192 domain-containing protein [Candidatus Pacebacteria bacterium]|nr:DUF192 domain-containing protein [Candidatus Paceibacterota bacterium]